MSDESILEEERNSQFWEETIELRNGERQLSREENALARYIQLTCEYGKIVISAVQGSVVGAFLGAILSTDFRVVPENTVFSFPCMRYRMPPQGALAFLLPGYIGIAKAKSILLRAEPILANPVVIEMAGSIVGATVESWYEAVNGDGESYTHNFSYTDMVEILDPDKK